MSHGFLRCTRRAGVLAAALLIAGIAPDAAPAQGEAGATRYVVADVVKLRAKPSTAGAIVAHLRIGTPVQVDAAGLGDGGAWVKVTVARATQGYAAAAFFGAAPPSVKALRADYEAAMAAGDRDGARRAAERLVALDPGQAEHLERLKALYERAGDAAARRRIADHLDGKGTKFIGYCVRNGQGARRAVLLAEYRPGFGFVGHVNPGWTETVDWRQETAGLNSLKLALQRGPLFGFDHANGAESHEIRGSPLLRAEVSDPPEQTLGTQESHRLLLFGQNDCGNDGVVYSNERLRALPSRPVDWPTLTAMIGGLPAQGDGNAFGVRAQRVAGGAPLVSLELLMWSESYRQPRLSDIGRQFVWGLFDGETGALLDSVGSYHALDAYMLVERVTWIGWERSGDRAAIVEYYDQTDGGGAGRRIRLIAVPADGGLHVRELMLDFMVTM